MTTLRTAIEDLLVAVARANPSRDLRAKVDRVRAALGTEPEDDGMVTERDGFRVEVADQFGFEDFNDDCTEHRCSTAALVAFAKSSERAGMFDACEIVRAQEKVTGDQHEAVVLGDIANVIEVRMAEIDAELKPILEAEGTMTHVITVTISGPQGCGKTFVKSLLTEILDAAGAGWAATHNDTTEDWMFDKDDVVRVVRIIEKQTEPESPPCS